MALKILLMVLFAFGSASAQVNVRLVTDEAEAVLNVLAKHKANQSIDDADWQRIFQSEGYVRLKKRETSRGSCSRRTTKPQQFTIANHKCPSPSGPSPSSTLFTDGAE